jgi:hypothetical protein
MACHCTLKSIKTYSHTWPDGRRVENELLCGGATQPPAEVAHTKSTTAKKHINTINHSSVGRSIAGTQLNTTHACMHNAQCIMQAVSSSLPVPASDLPKQLGTSPSGHSPEHHNPPRPRRPRPQPWPLRRALAPCSWEGLWRVIERLEVARLDPHSFSTWQEHFPAPFRGRGNEASSEPTLAIQIFSSLQADYFHCLPASESSLRSAMLSDAAATQRSQQGSFQGRDISPSTTRAWHNVNTE